MNNSCHLVASVTFALAGGVVVNYFSKRISNVVASAVLKIALFTVAISAIWNYDLLPPWEQPISRSSLEPTNCLIVGVLWWFIGALFGAIHAPPKNKASKNKHA